jgi:hypothetical protein
LELLDQEQVQALLVKDKIHHLQQLRQLEVEQEQV